MASISTMQERLLQLPQKISTPFTELFKAEHLSEETICGVLDFVQLGGRAEHALAYAVTYQYMISNHVPMKDILAMAKQHNRRINPKWSRTRWMEEHSKLGRISTLIALSTDNQEYDLSRFEQYLPKRFAGYIIRSSQRLGAEGLRQGHCVAVYDKFIRSGQTCIAAVFVKKERWTVQLSIIGNALRVQQIKAKYNKPASFEVRSAIHNILGLEMPRAEREDNDATENQTDNLKTNLLAICNRLRMIGVMRVVADFDGCGDSGTVDCPTLYGENDVKIDLNAENRDISVNYIDAVTHWDIETHRRTYTYETSVLSLEDALAQVIECHIDSKGQDWYNNDGGWGEYELNVTDSTYSMNINVRYTQSESVVDDDEVLIDDLED